MATQIFVNLPIKDLKASRAFYSALGYSFNEQFSDDTAACCVISDTIYVMLLTLPKFKGFSPNEIADPKKTTSVINCLSSPSKEEVSTLVAKALKAGGKRYSEPKDYGFMFQDSFQDPDGHCWELVYFDPNGIPT